MKATFVFASLRIFAVAQSVEGNCRCPRFWTEYNGHCYRFFNQPRVKFDTAREHCQNFALDPDHCPCRRAYLVTINSKAENTFIRNWWRTVRNNGNQQLLRIGYTRDPALEYWQWVGDNSSTFINWADEPRDADLKCGAMWKGEDSDSGTWRADNCQNLRAFMCEF